MNKKKKIMLTVGGVVVMAGVGTGLMASQKGPEVERAKYEVGPATSVAPLTQSGRVVAPQTELVDFGEGQVTLMVVNGQAVEQGQVLATVYSAEQQDATTEAQMALNVANTMVSQKQQRLTQLKVQAELADPGAIQAAQDELVAAQNEQRLAQTKLTALQGKINRQVVANFAGQVTVETERSAKPKVTVYGRERQIVGSVTDFDFDKIAVNQPVKIQATAARLTDDQAKIISVAQVGDAQNAKVTKYPFVTTANEQFKIGQKVTVTIPQAGVRLPHTAVQRANGHQVVYRVVSGKARVTKVSGIQSGAAFIVSEGLKRGEQVVFNPGKTNLDGRKVNG
jgi:HlyD family secretion protein